MSYELELAMLLAAVFGAACGAFTTWLWCGRSAPCAPGHCCCPLLLAEPLVGAAERFGKSCMRPVNQKLPAMTPMPPESSPCSSENQQEQSEQRNCSFTWPKHGIASASQSASTVIKVEGSNVVHLSSSCSYLGPTAPNRSTTFRICNRCLNKAKTN